MRIGKVFLRADNKERSAVPQIPLKPFRLETDFYKMASTLRAQFRNKVAGSFQTGVGITPLAYAFSEDAYQFLCAGAESIFTRDILDDLLNRLGSWASEALGTSHVSTPQVRIFIDGCWRSLLRDEVSAKWHYILSLSNEHRKKLDRIKVLIDGSSAHKDERSAHLGRVLSFQMKFNQLLVHDVGSPYEIEPIKTSMNPLDATFLLDGYLW